MRNLTRKAMSLLLLCCLGFYAQAQTTSYDITITTGTFPAEQSWELLDGSSAVVTSRPCGFYGAAGETVNVNLNDGETYTFNAFDDWGDGWNGGTWSIAVASSGCVAGSGVANNLLAGDGTDDCIGQQLEESFSFVANGPISGCTNPTAINFNACATVDDGSCLLPAVNDECANFINIPVGTCFTGSNIGATFNAADSLSPTCVDGSSTPADIWFRSTVPASGALIFDFPDMPGATSIIELYQGVACGALGAGILATAGSCSNYSSGGTRTVTGLTPGPVLIRYWDFGSNDFGPIEFCVSAPILGCTDFCASNYNPLANTNDGTCVYSTTPANGTDNCASAALLPGPGTYNAINAVATGTDITSCTFADSLDVWYRYNVPVGADTVWIYTCNSTYDTALSLWTACGGTEIACNDDGIRPGVGTLTSTCGINPATGLPRNFQSAIQLSDSVLALYAGSTIYIRVAGFGGQRGCGDLTIEEVGAAGCVPTAPTNQTSTNLSNRVQLNWTPTPLAVGCQVQGQRLPTGPSPSVNVLTAPYNTTNVPYAIAGAGTTWTWRVRCACSISPLVLSPYTAFGDTFSIPVAREGDILDLTLFPNPADNQLMVAFGAQGGEVTMTIVDMLGRIITTRTEMSVEGANNASFDVSSLETGNYFLNIEEAGVMQTQSFSVAH